MAVTFFPVPPPQAFICVLLLYVQACLLHPSIPTSVSRALRLGLMLPTLVLGAGSTFWWRIDPINYAIPANFRWGIFGPYFTLKALEWGLAKDSSHYQYVGFDPQNSSNLNKQDDSPKLVAADVGSDTEVKRRAKQTADRAAVSHPGVFGVLAFGLQLGASMRGIGWSFGPPAKALGPPRPTNQRAFLVQSLKNMLRAHIVSTVCLILIIHRHDVPRLIQSTLPFAVDGKALVPIANVAAYLSVGFSLYAQMCMGFEGSGILWLVGTNVLRAIMPAHLAPAPFDSRQFPPLFNRPFEMTDITGFWALRWHALFRKVFLSVGYEPTLSSLTPVIGKQGAKAVGSLVVFALSSWMHDQAFLSARHGLPAHVLRPLASLSFTERYGAWLFFLAQAVATVLESLFRSTTGRKVGGWPGRLWSFVLVFGLGCMAARAWLAMGFVHGLPPVQDWGWARWVFPSAALAPPTHYMRKR